MSSSAKVIINLPASYTLKEVSKELQKLSYKELSSEQAQGNLTDPIYQADKGKRTTDSGVIKKAFKIVEITQRADNLVKALKYLIPRLLEKSPVKSGRYKGNHYMDIDGVRTVSLSSIGNIEKEVEGAREVRIYNTSIYANKLEREGNSSSKIKSNLTFIKAQGVYDFFSRKIRGASFAGVISRVGRSDSYPVLYDPRYTSKEGKSIVLPVIYLSIDEGEK